MEVSSHYDPLLAKIIAHGETREEALRKLDLALSDTVVLGLRTNVGFLRRVLAHPPFEAGALRTDLLEIACEELCPGPEPGLGVFLAAAAHALLPGGGGYAVGNGVAGTHHVSPWTTLHGFRLSKKNGKRP